MHYAILRNRVIALYILEPMEMTQIKLDGVFLICKQTKNQPQGRVNSDGKNVFIENIYIYSHGLVKI